MSAIFTQATEWNFWQGENPCWRLKTKIGGVAEVYPAHMPKADGLQRFLGELGDTAIISAEGARLLILTCQQLAIGTRVCEALALQLRDVDSQTETVKIQRD